ncbi:hypothetical protein FXN63_16110 [Pigmentiphaga aceris]|uniref:EpsG family protein n=1 Tax=Pigmentiphaga aceris TaxID=1940612 RepID=A0A5C0B0G5_9BURK|nr:hypothetical protein [Pigmentiphaga aceris]QEI07193.1 hypothetical protein FXN63_16110 [Pigmentiphaga aceris]
MNTGYIRASYASGAVSAARTVVPLAVGLACTMFSLYIFPYYTSGDQLYYRNFYDGLPFYDWTNGLGFYADTLDSREPGYYTLVFLLAPLIEKDWLMSILNGALGYVLTLWLLRVRTSMIVIALVFTNFYLLVLFFSAERLKLAMLCFLLAFTLRGPLRYVFAGLSVLTHSQTMILWVSRLAYPAWGMAKRLMTARLDGKPIRMLGGLLGATVAAFLLYEHVVGKFLVYAAESGGIQTLLKPLAFLIAAQVYAHGRRFEALLVHLPIMAAAYAVGPDRVVIFSYFAFMYYGVQYRRGLNVLTMVFLVYFALKGVTFIEDTIHYGSGFMAEPGAGHP